MSNRPIPDPVEAAVRDLCAAVYADDERAAMAAIERRSDLDTLQYAGDGFRLVIALAGSGIRSTMPAEPVSPGRQNRHALP